MEQTKNSKIRLSSFDQEIPANQDGTEKETNNKIPIQQFLNKNHIQVRKKSEPLKVQIVVFEELKKKKKRR